MNQYLIHRKYYVLYLHAMEELQKLIDERERLFNRVEPKSSVTDRDRVTGGTRVNSVEEYIIAMEQRHVKDRIEEAKAIVKDREEMMLLKEAELRRSKDLYTRIYVMKWIDGYKADRIIQSLDLSRSQVYNIIDYIRKQVER